MNQVTIEKAREIIGIEESANFSDEQLQQLIFDLSFIAREMILAMREGEITIT